ncbi:helix-turn-helix domain-containing protein [Thermoleophilia bacterium SCSIO 60948]|nr:helix-turn-helix domain-containing protein [Thermoleophilia bacterium SCSIO 60948]
MDRAQLADFLRRRREALGPEDVGMAPGPRRRAPGLRREEVASLAHMSTDYLSRLEQGRGPNPSEQMIRSLARALRLTHDERNHLLVLAGYPPSRSRRTDLVNPALLRVLDRLDTPAQVLSALTETLAQNEFALALLGDQMRFTGPHRYHVYRWFCDPAERERYAPEDREPMTRGFVAGGRMLASRYPDDPEVEELLERLRADSEEFARIWSEHEVMMRASHRKRLIHPSVGRIELDCQALVSEDDGQSLLVYTATPGTEDHDKLRLLSVVGSQAIGSATPTP